MEMRTGHREYRNERRIPARRGRWSLRGLLVLGLLLVAAVGSADGGRIEINQTRALEGGVTPGDAAGFPIVLNEPGSYVLTGNLSVSSPTAHAVLIGSNDVTLDLAGHVLTGPRTCTGEGAAISCDLTAPGGAGIRFFARQGVVIRNGTIRGFDDGIDGTLSAGCILEGLDVARNRGVGIDADQGCLVLENVFDRNGSFGLVAAFSSVVMRSVAVGNALDGIFVQSSVVHDSTSRINGRDGFSGGGFSTLTSNTASANGGDGMAISNAALVLGNAMTLNTEHQLEMSALPTALAGWARNVLLTDPAIPTSATFIGGTQIGPNLCDGSLCP